MFYLKNDDMEELFRKAAENYNVDTTRASDWEAVSNTLHSQSPEKGKDKKKKKKRRFIFWWFLLFPAGWAAHYVWVKTGEQSLKKTPAVQQYQTPVAGKANSDIEKNGKTLTGVDNLVKRKEQRSMQEEDQLIEKNISSINHVIKQNEKTGTPIEHTLNVRQNNPGVKKDLNIKGRNRNKLQQQDVSSIHDSNDDKTENKILPEIQQVKRYSKYYALPGGNLQIPVQAEKITRDTDSNTSKKNKTENNEVKRNTHYFYIDAMAAPDLSMVKFQRISGAGSSFGILAGYRINKRWHVETGAFLEKKLYYTEGKYFDKSKLSAYLQNVKMLSVDGNCRMITVPLNIRYNVFAGQNSNWFVAGGMASYFMSREYYDYTYQHSTEPPKTKGYLYKVSEKNWMTVININIGYERPFWKNYHFRIEPYFRLPVSGVGTGNLSLSSGGIYLGFGRRF